MSPGDPYIAVAILTVALAIVGLVALALIPVDDDPERRRQKMEKWK